MNRVEYFFLFALQLSSTCSTSLTEFDKRNAAQASSYKHGKQAEFAAKKCHAECTFPRYMTQVQNKKSNTLLSLMSANLSSSVFYMYFCTLLIVTYQSFFLNAFHYVSEQSDTSQFLHYEEKIPENLFKTSNNLTE